MATKTEECDICSGSLASLESDLAPHPSPTTEGRNLVQLRICQGPECGVKMLELERALEDLLVAREGLIRALKGLALTQRKKELVRGKLAAVWEGLRSLDFDSLNKVTGDDRSEPDKSAEHPTSLRPKRSIKRKRRGILDENDQEKTTATKIVQEDTSRLDLTKYFCDKCKKGFTSQEGFWGHSKFHFKGVVNEDGSFQCPHCPESFEKSESLHQHERKDHRLPRDFCPICKKQMSRNSLQQHLQSHYLKQSSFPLSAEDIECVICGRQFNSPLFLALHLEVHKGDCSCHVPSCRKSFGTFELREDHMRKVHYQNAEAENLGPSQQEDCPYCNDFDYDQTLEFKSHIQQHELLEIPKSRFLCHTCGCSFVTKKSLETHIRLSHDDTKELKCDICDKVFENSGVLKCHRRTHQSQKTSKIDATTASFICSEPSCGKSFNQKVSLQNHVFQVHHSGEMRYKCTHCEDQGQSKRFTYPQGLRDHIFKEHKNVLAASRNKYVCNVCYKTFGTEQELLEHEGGHVKSKCQICGKQFKSVAHLKEHTLRHAAVRPFKCVHCPKGYFRERQLQDHTKKAHANAVGSNEPLSQLEAEPPPHTDRDRITYIIQLPS